MPFVDQEPALIRCTRRALVLRTLAVFFVIALTGSSHSYASAPEAPNHSLRIIATDKGYQFPDSLAEGMAHVVFENRGSTMHEAMFIKLPDDMTGEDYLRAVSNGTAFPEGALDYSGPGLTSPGETIEMWLHLDPGNYLLGCWFRGHLTSLSAQSLTIYEGESGGTAPPKHDATLRLIDFRFELEGQLSPGAQTLRVETPGPSIHEVDIFRLEEGRTLADLRQWHKEGKKGAAPAVAVGGVLDSHDLSRVVWLRTDFRPGHHILWCNMPMMADGPGPAGDVTHADAGMIKEFAIED